MTTPYHHGDLKSTLLAYARDTLEDTGLEGMSLREMAKAVGVSHTAAYRHFADKQSLLHAVAEQGFDELLAASRVAMAEAAPDGPSHRPDSETALVACGLAYVRFGRQHPRLLNHMFSAATRADAPEGLRAVAAELFSVLMDCVAQGQAEGRFRAGDTRALAHGCWALVHGLAGLQGGRLLPLQPAGSRSSRARISDAQANEQARSAIALLLRGLVGD